MYYDSVAFSKLWPFSVKHNRWCSKINSFNNFQIWNCLILSSSLIAYDHQREKERRICVGWTTELSDFPSQLTLQMFCGSVIEHMRSNHKSLRPRLSRMQMKVFLLEYIADLTGGSETNWEGEMANNCTIIALCWMINLSSQTRQKVGGRGDLWKVMWSFLLSACLWKVVAKAEKNPAFKRNDWERFVFFCCLLSTHFWIVCVLKACVNQFSYFFP